MNTKYMTAIAAVGLSLAVGPACMAAPSLAAVTPRPVVVTPAPAVEVPTGYVWDGSEYVGQVGGKYYYLGPHNTWVELDKTRQHRFEDYQKKNPNWQSRQIRNTRYQGHDMGQSHPASEHKPPPDENSHTH